MFLHDSGLEQSHAHSYADIPISVLAPGWQAVWSQRGEKQFYSLDPYRKSLIIPILTLYIIFLMGGGAGEKSLIGPEFTNLTRLADQRGPREPEVSTQGWDHEQTTMLGILTWALGIWLRSTRLQASCLTNCAISPALHYLSHNVSFKDTSVAIKLLLLVFQITPHFNKLPAIPPLKPRCMGSVPVSSWCLSGSKSPWERKLIICLITVAESSALFSERQWSRKRPLIFPNAAMSRFPG